MSDPSIYAAPSPKPIVPAWVLSVIIHSATISLLCFVFHPNPRGSGDARAGSIGLVLHPANAPGNSDDGAHNVRQALATAEELTAPVLLAANEVTEPTTNQNNSEPQQSPTSQSGTASGKAKPGQSQSKSAGKTGSHPASSRAQLGSSGSGAYAQVSVFGVQGQGNKFIYVFDRSGSMDGPPLAAAKKQLIESLQSLDSIQQFHILFFNTRIQAFDVSGGGRRIAFATDRNKKLAANFVGGITADGGTDRMTALREAINFAPDVIFFLTDADDPMSPAELAEIDKANRKVQAAICVIEFGKKPAPTPNNFLARLAHDTGGQYGYVDTSKLH